MQEMENERKAKCQEWKMQETENARKKEWGVEFTYNSAEELIE